MARKTLVVSFSPGEGPFDTPSWVDISSRVRTAEWTWGRQRDDQGFPPGQATLTLHNHDRLFDPDNTSGTYTGLLLPRVPFRFQTDTGEDLFYGFVEDGWEQTYDHPADGYCTVKLVDLLAIIEGYPLAEVFDAAVLALGPVGYWPLTGASLDGKVADLGSGHNDGEIEGDVSFDDTPVGSGAGSAVFDGTGDHIFLSRGPILDDVADATVVATVNTTTYETLLSGLPDPVFSHSDGNDGTPGPGTTRLEVNIWADLTDSFGAPTIIWSKVGGGLQASDYTSGVTDGADHLIIAQTDTTDPLTAIAVDTATLVVSGGTNGLNYSSGVTIGGTKTNGFAGRIGHVALFNFQMTTTDRQTLVDAFNGLSGETSDQHVAWALDQIGVPAGMRDLDTGRAIMGSARTDGVNALQFINRVAATEHGAFYVNHADGGKLRFVERFSPWLATRSTTSQATFSDDSTATGVARVVPGTLIVESNGVRTITNQASVKWVDGEEPAENATSVAAYGPRGRTVDTVATSAAVARGLAQWIVALGADPRARVRGLTVNPGAAVAEFDIAVDTRVGDLVTFRSQPSSTGSVVTRNLLVEGVTHRVEDLRWETSFYTSLTPADVVDLFILGTSTLNGTHVLGY